MMSSASIWLLVALCAVITFAIKAAGPVALGGRELPGWFDAVIAMMAPALLAALVATQTLASGRHLELDAKTVGVVLAGLVMWRTRSVVAAIVVAAVATAVLRAL